MSQYPKLTLTDTAIEMIAESQLGDIDLEITRVKIGDGTLPEDTDIKAMTDVIASRTEAPMTSSKNDSAGQLTINFAISNENVDTGFFAREIGIFAKLTDGEEKLYAYTNAGNKCDWIPDKRTPIDSQVVTATIVVGNAANVTANIKDNAYVLTIELKEHNADANAHAEMLEKHNADPDAHPNLKVLIQNSGINILKRSHTYEVGDIAYSPLLKSYQRLECVVGGVTASSDIDVSSSTTGGVIVDGACTWLLTDTRDGTPVGAVRGSLYLPAGYVKANGAEVQRADYPRLVALADTYNLWREETVDYTFAGTFAKSATTITDVSTDDMRKIRIGDTLAATGLAADTLVTAMDYSQNTVTISVAATAAGSKITISGSGKNHQNGLFGRGDGDSTFILPDYTDRMIQLADTAGLSIDAGLPNIAGELEIATSPAFPRNCTGPFIASRRGYREAKWGASGNEDNFQGVARGWIVSNASLSNIVYGASDTVQPPAITLIPIIRY